MKKNTCAYGLTYEAGAPKLAVSSGCQETRRRPVRKPCRRGLLVLSACLADALPPYPALRERRCRLQQQRASQASRSRFDARSPLPPKIAGAPALPGRALWGPKIEAAALAYRDFGLVSRRRTVRLLHGRRDVCKGTVASIGCCSPGAQIEECWRTSDVAGLPSVLLPACLVTHIIALIQWRGQRALGESRTAAVIFGEKKIAADATTADPRPSAVEVRNLASLANNVAQPRGVLGADEREPRFKLGDASSTLLTPVPNPRGTVADRERGSRRVGSGV
ncbi:hypothetical protein HPB51_007606 [Rhipicephalus microplus]|uniref:Uncharacterized protein n=1 Tax=Rhipicephalus microplus TaxID=6941 RepID=A0A9J6D4H1_RHIMP|nr:hypothetical protein HPB51_007606 [Rhipicephalus microplus]